MAIDDGQEKVLCVPTEFLWEAVARATGQATRSNEVSASVVRRLANQAQGFRPFHERFPAARFLDELEEAGASYQDRTSVLERDPQFKQLIPYAYLSCQGRVWFYRRVGKEGDPRLRGKITPGVGGHVNPEDQGRSLSATLWNGLQRELREEVRYECGSSIHPEGIVNDDSDAVGSVHFGIVYRVELARPEAVANDPALLGMGWHRPAEVLALAGQGYQLEGWSRLLVESLVAAGSPPAAMAP